MKYTIHKVLPREIELRQQQYAHYRDLLLKEVERDWRSLESMRNTGRHGASQN